MNVLIDFLNDETGATAVEYAVMLAAILLACIGAISALGGANGDLWGGIQGDMEAHGIQ